MSLTLQIVVSGLAAGGVYGLFALGYSAVYRLTGVVNFAFGDLVALGVFATLLVASGLGPVSRTSVGGGRLLVAVLVGVAVCVAASAATYTAAVQPYLARGWPVGWVAATVALGFAIRALLGAVFEQPSYVVPDPLRFDRIGDDGVISLAGASLQVRSFFVIALAVALAAAASAFLGRTRVGKGLRAIADDADAAHTVGLPVDRLLSVAFALAGAVAALGAIAAAPSAPFDVDSGALLGVKGLVAALVVQFGPPWHALAAGLGLGLAEAVIANADVGGVELGTGWGQVLPLAAALALLALWPPREAAEERE
jgi:branched-chain amino acid transport system permease protein